MDTSESVIRHMTRLAVEHDAVNLAQGFTDEAPAFDLVWGALTAILGGEEEGIKRLESTTLRDLVAAAGDQAADVSLKQLLSQLQSPSDRYNQYSYPFGLPELRQAIAAYTERWSGFLPDPESEITVVLGATEGVSTVLNAVCQPGDGVVIVQPFHEMYPSQAGLFGLRPRYVTLHEDPASETWNLNVDELEAVVDEGTRLLILNTPHNPTGKVFTRSELAAVADLCRRRNLLVITDEIYEHILYRGHRHHCLATFPEMRERTFVVNSISKTGNATGWRVGWVLSPAAYTKRIRSIHDTLVIQAPTPLQKGAVKLLGADPEDFARLGRTYAEKADLLLKALRLVGFRASAPEGSYYLFADYRQVPTIGELGPTAAARWLIEVAGVACVPGDNFYAVGEDGERYLRFAFCRSIASLREAAQRLSSHLT
jgi:aspartate/methionine/tyrosine aminotransferase